MRITDTFKLVKHEYNYGKIESISSILMHTVIMGCILLTLTIATEISHVCNDYMGMIYTDGYIFFLKGFEQEDSAWLEERGFKDIAISDDGSSGMATADSIERIWLYKFQALFGGKDLWSEDTDLILEIILFGIILFAAIAFILFVVMINSITNSFSMKLDERGRYIEMLMGLGAAKRYCVRIFALFFMLRELAALALAVCLNAVIVRCINKYIVNVIHIKTAFSILKPQIIAVIAAFGILIICFSFRKVWSKKNEL